MYPSISISLHQSCSSLSAPAAVLSCDGHMTLCDLHTHTSADKADTLTAHSDHWSRLSVPPPNAHLLILLSSQPNQTQWHQEMEKKILIFKILTKYYTCQNDGLSILLFVYFRIFERRQMNSTLTDNASEITIFGLLIKKNVFLRRAVFSCAIEEKIWF